MNPLEALKLTYQDLLLHPHDSWRIKNQATLARCRDAIASADNRSAREVQDQYEYSAYLLKKSMLNPNNQSGRAVMVADENGEPAYSHVEVK